MSDISRRNFMRNAVVGAASISTLGLLAGCSAQEKQAEQSESKTATSTEQTATANMLDPKTMPDAATASNFQVVEESKTTVGSTLENLKAAIRQHRQNYLKISRRRDWNSLFSFSSLSFSSFSLAAAAALSRTSLSLAANSLR